jgi:hypothetical protein
MKTIILKVTLLAVAAAAVIGGPHAIAQYCFPDCPRVDASCPYGCWPTEMWSIDECTMWGQFICCQCTYGTLYCQCGDDQKIFGFQHGKYGVGYCRTTPPRACIFTGKVTEN